MNFIYRKVSYNTFITEKCVKTGVNSSTLKIFFYLKQIKEWKHAVIYYTRLTFMKVFILHRKFKILTDTNLTLNEMYVAALIQNTLCIRLPDRASPTCHKSNRFKVITHHFGMCPKELNQWWYHIQDRGLQNKAMS